MFDLGTRELRFSDPRRFGQVDVVTRATERTHPALAVLGPDPITDGIDVAAFFARSRKKKAQLKPTARAYRLTSESAARLAAAIREVLEHALTKGGTSLRDFVDADGREGENIDYLWVYGRTGEPCPRCKTPIRRSVVQGRATFFCPTCQAR